MPAAIRNIFNCLPVWSALSRHSERQSRGCWMRCEANCCPRPMKVPRKCVNTLAPCSSHCAHCAEDWILARRGGKGKIATEALGVRDLRRGTGPALELHAQGELDNAWVVQASARSRLLEAYILQAGGGVGRHVVGVVERIEEIGCKTHIEPLFDLEVLVKGEVVVPPAWADDIVP